jgi:hypothetical protein
MTILKQVEEGLWRRAWVIPECAGQQFLTAHHFGPRRVEKAVAEAVNPGRKGDDLITPIRCPEETIFLSDEEVEPVVTTGFTPDALQVIRGRVLSKQEIDQEFPPGRSLFFERRWVPVVGGGGYPSMPGNAQPGAASCEVASGKQVRGLFPERGGRSGTIIVFIAIRCENKLKRRVRVER